jgi:hypothetical protein
MKNAVELKALLGDADRARPQQAAVFALLCLGIIDSLANGLLGAADAVRLFFNAENCLFVRKRLRDKLADKIMSHGVQLPDLFDVLPTDETHREFQRELAAMRSLCLKIVEDMKLVA